ncbi:MAG TPA: phage tail assembly protein [Coriobacteriia bacterium]|nr:phage tail assembly protein [Coriobacteriia bacterium]
MTEPKVAREVAESEVSRWAELMEADPSASDRGNVARAIMSGRLSLDEGAETFLLRLRHPIKLENKAEFDTLTVRAPTFRESCDAAKGKNDSDTTLRLLGAITEQPIGILERLPQKEINLLGSLLSFFG